MKWAAIQTDNGANHIVDDGPDWVATVAEEHVGLVVAAPELLAEARNVRQYIGKLAADHDGDFMGRSASGALRKLQAAIDKAEAVQS